MKSHRLEILNYVNSASRIRPPHLSHICGYHVRLYHNSNSASKPKVLFIESGLESKHLRSALRNWQLSQTQLVPQKLDFNAKCISITSHGRSSRSFLTCMSTFFEDHDSLYSSSADTGIPLRQLIAHYGRALPLDIKSQWNLRRSSALI